MTNDQYIVAAAEASVERDELKIINKILLEALIYAEDILGFHEGSEEKIHNAGKPVVWINAEGFDGDFQTVLRRIRAAIAADRAGVKRMIP